MDIDATATGFSVDPSTLKETLLSICSVDLQDGFSFSFVVFNDKISQIEALKN